MISDNKVAEACTYATRQIRRFYEGEGEPDTCLPHAKAFAKHSKVINEGILERQTSFKPPRGEPLWKKETAVLLEAVRELILLLH